MLLVPEPYPGNIKACNFYNLHWYESLSAVHLQNIITHSADSHIQNTTTVPQNKNSQAITQALISCFAPWRPGFNPRPDHVRFVVDNVALEWALLWILVFPCHNNSISSPALVMGNHETKWEYSTLLYFSVST